MPDLKRFQEEINNAIIKTLSMHRDLSYPNCIKALINAIQFYRRPQFNGYECLTVQTRYRYDEGRTCDRQYRALQCCTISIFVLAQNKMLSYRRQSKMKK